MRSYLCLIIAKIPIHEWICHRCDTAIVSPPPLSLSLSLCLLYLCTIDLYNPSYLVTPLFNSDLVMSYSSLEFPPVPFLLVRLGLFPARNGVLLDHSLLWNEALRIKNHPSPCPFSSLLMHYG